MTTKALITIQPAEFVDHITEDSTELTKLPYPVHAWSEDGRVPKNMGGWTEPERIVGFQRDPSVQQVDVPWHVVREDPDQAVGLYVVAANADGSMTSLTTAVRDVRVSWVEVPDTISPLNAAPDGSRRREGWE